MSEKSHNTGGTVPKRALPASWRILGWLGPLWLALGAAVLIIPSVSPKALDTLALADPNPSIRLRLDGLRLTRGLLLPPGPGGRQIWQGREADGFFLAGAVHAERQGRSAEARLWLALELLGRGDRAGARKMWESAGGGQALPETLDPRNPASWGPDVLERLQKSLE